jgi:hypothetical protein
MQKKWNSHASVAKHGTLSQILSLDGGQENKQFAAKLQIAPQNAHFPGSLNRARL